MATIETLFAGKTGIASLRSQLSNYFNAKALRNLEVNRGDLLYPPSIYEVFREPPLFAASVGTGNPGGTAGDENLMLCNETTWRYHIIGTQTALKPVWTSTAIGGGLNIGMDQTDGDGVEFSTGVSARAPFVLVSGTSGGYFEVDLTVQTVAGLEDMAVGWRKASAFAALDGYTDVACLNMQAGDVKIETILNDAATTTTDTTLNMTDGQQIRMRIDVSTAGVVTYSVGVDTTSINGPAASPPATTAAFTFDSGDYLLPFIYMKHNSTVGGDVILQKVECGYF